MSENSRNHRISVTQGMSGFFAVMVADYEDMNWCTDVVQTGFGRYKLQADAIKEAKRWAEDEGVPFESPSLDGKPARQDVEAQIREIMPDVKVIRLGE